jgi:hypothetical protein
MAEETGVDLLVLGPHRRQLLRDVFVGTTAERVLRSSHTTRVSSRRACLKLRHFSNLRHAPTHSIRAVAKASSVGAGSRRGYCGEARRPSVRRRNAGSIPVAISLREAYPRSGLRSRSRAVDRRSSKKVHK